MTMQQNFVDSPVTLILQAVNRLILSFVIHKLLQWWPL